ncbi:ash family protein [Glaesserella parasuis]|uniref:ash family protein n=1 Tax=Glaesserella parasuis TaxID=738 RepID=UPI001365CBE2|nr:ash family protein [Glaesserella parasuis]MDG6265667.1 ash family protein [Glaesserella parasuis]MDP0232286.1 ash family protein [Glaesserella parasuis]MDP0240737.1 ash family protein [Glaesserella parasuis]MDP0322298.1 ash family protein [Glaesserella parasuis]MDP0324502.1 ash family protein [Glaesserella parasuis]
MKNHIVNINRDITLFHLKINLNENISLYKMLSEIYSVHVVAKSTTEPQNSNDLYLANSTPQACFFIRSTRTPKEKTFPKNGERSFLSMVGRIGQSLRLAVFPMVTVFHPDTFYRQAWKLAVDVKNLPLEFSQMFYTFLFIHSRLRISVFANSLTEAYSRLPKSDIKPLLIARKSQAKGGVYQAKAQADLAYQTLKAQYKTVEMVHIGGLSGE